MSLLWPGEQRAGDLFDDAALLGAMVAVEQAWLDSLVEAGIAPTPAQRELTELVSAADAPRLAEQAETAGNPVVPLVGLLRERLPSRSPEPAAWLHRGLTSQDVLDTALVIQAGLALDRLLVVLHQQISSLVELAERHRDDRMVARTMTQYAVPYTFGRKAAAWLDGVLDAAEPLPRLRAELPAQLGGASGTQAALHVLAGGDARRTEQTTSRVAQRLGLTVGVPWQTNRAPLTRLGDAWVTLTDAWAHIANDVLTLSRSEIGELAEPAGPGRGGSSTMPHKVNPVLATLIRRTALTAPLLGAQLHLAAADSSDERSAGAWHTEWSTLATLGRRTLAAADQTAELVAGLQVDTERMAERLTDAAAVVFSERESLASLVSLIAPAATGTDEAYLGMAGEQTDAVCRRARTWLRRA